MTEGPIKELSFLIFFGICFLLLGLCFGLRVRQKRNYSNHSSKKPETKNFIINHYKNNKEKSNSSCFKIFILVLISLFLILWLTRFTLKPLTIQDKYEILIDMLGILFGSTGVVGAGVWYILKNTTKTQIDASEKRLKNQTSKHKKSLTNLLFCMHLIDWCIFIEEDYQQDIINFLKNHEKTYQKSTPEWLKELISRAEKALWHAEKSKLETGGNAYLMINAKNNLAYYLTIAHTEEGRARGLIEEVNKESIKLPQYKKYWYQYKDTYMWVLWIFGSKKEKIKACKIFNELWSQQDIITQVSFKKKLEIYQSLFAPKKI